MPAPKEPASPSDPLEKLREQPRIAAPSPCFAHGTWHEISGSCFAGPIRLEWLRALDQQQGELVARYPAGIGTVNIIHLNPTMKSIEGKERDLSESIVKRFGPMMRANATIIFGGGFVAAAARSVMMAQRLVARVRYPDGVFSNLPAASVWVAQQLHYSDTQRAEALAFFVALSDACQQIRMQK